jgi:hypothetical protein
MGRSPEPLDEVWDRELANNVLHAANAAEDYLKGAQKRDADMLRVHAEGWKLVAGAIGKGLSEIASAIRANGQR